MNKLETVSPNTDLLNLIEKELIRLHNHLSSEYCDDVLRATILRMISDIHVGLNNPPVFVNNNSEVLPF